MIQPIDIKTKKFKKGILGYKSADVDDFINTVYRAYEDVYNENAKLSDSLDKLNASLQENRLKMFDLESKVQKMENVSSYDDDSNAKKKADDIIKNAEKAAAEIIANAKKESSKFEAGAAAPKPEKKVEPVKEEPVKESASSRFFKKVEEEAPVSSASEDDDEIFVGEIEDSRKPDRMMIGDGEEEEDMDFEFL
ncbi:MAG: DivIVA domain-containing protein [Clostridium sp.]|nr:DivIVA domain-containing protein [Clostridium sp.]MCM1458598.1 DivIVA domain-containing protein [Bacteroides sp.]